MVLPPEKTDHKRKDRDDDRSDDKNDDGVC